MVVQLECRHWDVIEMPNGPISIGRCKKCGRKREYNTSNWYEGAYFQPILLGEKRED